jgi:hypothetical protein
MVYLIARKCVVLSKLYRSVTMCLTDLLKKTRLLYTHHVYGKKRNVRCAA